MSREDEAREALERWSGYSDQTWEERYHELSRRYAAAQMNTISVIQTLHESREAYADRRVAEERERAARVAMSHAEEADCIVARSRDGHLKVSVMGEAIAGRAIAAAIRADASGEEG